MRIGFVISDFYPVHAGAERVLLNLAKDAMKRGHAVRVLTRAQPGTPSEDEVEGVPVVRLPTGAPGRGRAASLGLNLSLWSYLRRHSGDFDLLHSHMLSTLTATCAAASDRPLLATLQAGGPVGDVGAMKGYLLGPAKLRYILKRLAFATTVNRAVAEELKAEGFPADRIEVIYSGIDPDEYFPPDDGARRAARGRLGYSPEHEVVLFSGRFRKEKNLPALLRAFARLERPQARLLLSGEGPEEAALRALAAELEIADRLTIDPSHPLAHYHAADLSVLPSTSDGIALAVLEAMSTGLPVLLADIPGPREIISEGVEGRLLPPGDVEAWTRALAELLDDPGRRARMGTAARRRVQSTFGLAGTMEQYERVFRRFAPFSAVDA